MKNPFVSKAPTIPLKLEQKSYERKDKWYLKDLCLLGLVSSLFDLKNHTNDKKILWFHKNRHRKELKKIEPIIRECQNLRDRLILALDEKDRARLSKLTTGFAPIFFKMGEDIKGINLDTLSVNIIFVRFQKRTNLHKDFEKIKDFKHLFTIIKNVEKAGLLVDDGTKEFTFAKEICEAMNKF